MGKYGFKGENVMRSSTQRPMQKRRIRKSSRGAQPLGETYISVTQECKYYSVCLADI